MIFGFEWIPEHDRQLGYNYKSFTNKTYKIRSGMYGFEWTPSNDAQKQFAFIPVTKTLILSESNYKKYDVNGWQIVSPTLPTQAEFELEGMDDLSVLNRKVQSVIDSPFLMTDDGALGLGKVFKSTVDLTKYKDLRKLEVK